MSQDFARAPALSSLEVALGLAVGLDKTVVPLRSVRGKAQKPVEALEAVLLRALERPPCLVSFSGGRDSSGLLAVAARVARDRGLDLPVPATLVFPGDEAAAEDEWQVAVLRELQLPDWQRFEISPGELDAVGPYATKALVRHGLLWPPNTHFHFPIIEKASGGTVVTGFGGDEIARASASARAERLLARQQRESFMSTIAAVGFAFAPTWVRELVFERRSLVEVPWLTPVGRRAAREQDAHDDASVPFGFDRKLCDWVCRSRYFAVCQGSLSALAAGCDVELVSPFVAREVLVALAARGGIPGFGEREDFVRALFGGVLPPATITRRSKATFNGGLWTATALEFAREWSGEGVDHSLVDADSLRAHWLGGQPSAASATLLQEAWLREHSRAGATTEAGQISGTPTLNNMISRDIT